MLKPGAEVLTPSAAVRSGFWRTMPPLVLRLPGVISAPVGVRMIRRGPSALKLSVVLTDVKAFGNGPGGVVPSNGAARRGCGQAERRRRSAVAALWHRRC